MMNKYINKHHIKYFILVFLIIISFLATFLIFNIRVKNTLENNTNIHAIESLSLFKNNFRIAMRGQLDMLLVHSNYITNTTDKNNLEESYDKIRYNLLMSGFNEFIISDSNGNYLSNNDVVYDVVDRKFFNESLDGNDHISDVVYDSKGNSYNFFSVPIFTTEGDVYGTLAVPFTTLRMYDLFNNFKYTNKYDYFIIDSNAIIVVDNANINLGKELSFINDDNRQDILKNLKSGNDSVFEVSIEGKEYQFVFSSLNNSNDWHIATLIPLSTIYKSSNLINLFGFVMLLFLLIIFLIVFTINYKKYIKKYKQIENLSNFDKNLNCYNQKMFIQYTQELISNSRNYSIIELDINNFKLVNEFLGYNEGNSILKSISLILNNEIKENEIFARKFGDTFLLLLESYNDIELLKRIQDINKKISNYTNNNIEKYNLNLSWGVYNISSGLFPVENMIDKANVARRSQKNPRLNTFAFFDDNLKSKLLEEKRLQSRINNAINNDEIKVVIQPIFDPNTSEILAGEACARWYIDNEVVKPNKFIKLFEDNSMILDLDLHILDCICRDLHERKINNAKDIFITCNISYKTLSHKDFLNKLFIITKKYDLSPRNIGLEIDEEQLYINKEEVFDKLKYLSKCGYNIVLDNFGLGYSSLNILKDLHVNIIKLNPEYNFDNQVKTKILIDNIIEMAHELNISILLVQVDTDEQFEFAKSLNTNYIQGYHYFPEMIHSQFMKQFNK